eukprot:273155-Pleurochrysis_carterae.AAC.1
MVCESVLRWVLRALKSPLIHCLQAELGPSQMSACGAGGVSRPGYYNILAPRSLRRIGATSDVRRRRCCPAERRSPPPALPGARMALAALLSARLTPDAFGVEP